MNISAIYGISTPAHPTPRLIAPAKPVSAPDRPADSPSLPPATLGQGVEILSAQLGISALELVKRLTSGRGIADLLGPDDNEPVGLPPISGLLLDGYV